MRSASWRPLERTSRAAVVEGFRHGFENPEEMRAGRRGHRAGSRCRRRTAQPSAVMNTVMGQPPCPVMAWTAVMYTESTSGRSSRSTLMLMKVVVHLGGDAVDLSNDSRSITWHQWHEE